MEFQTITLKKLKKIQISKISEKIKLIKHEQT